jgi:hypothetical protein
MRPPPQCAAKPRLRRKSAWCGGSASSAASCGESAAFRRKLRQNSAQNAPKAVASRSMGAVQGSDAEPAQAPTSNLDVDFCRELNQRSDKGTREERPWPPWPTAVVLRGGRAASRFAVLLSFSRYPQSLTLECNEGIQLRGGGACAICLFVCPSAFRAVFASQLHVHLYTNFRPVSIPVSKILAS